MLFAFNEKSLYIKTTWRNCFGSPDLGEEVPPECVGSFVTATASKGWAGLCLCDWTSCSRINCHCFLSLHHTDAQLLVKGIFHFLSLLSHKTSPDVTSPKDLDQLMPWSRIEFCRLKYTFDDFGAFRIASRQTFTTVVSYQNESFSSRCSLLPSKLKVGWGARMAALILMEHSHCDRTPQYDKAMKSYHTL